MAAISDREIGVAKIMQNSAEIVKHRTRSKSADKIQTISKKVDLVKSVNQNRLKISYLNRTAKIARCVPSFTLCYHSGNSSLRYNNMKNNRLAPNRYFSNPP
jgi:hypothetical protein